MLAIQCDGPFTSSGWSWDLDRLPTGFSSDALREPSRLLTGLSDLSTEDIGDLEDLEGDDSYAEMVDKRELQQLEAVLIASVSSVTHFPDNQCRQLLRRCKWDANAATQLAHSDRADDVKFIEDLGVGGDLAAAAAAAASAALTATAAAAPAEGDAAIAADVATDGAVGVEEEDVDEDENLCPICYDELTEETTCHISRCGHKVCVDCMEVCLC